eukprot:TRINITY_DN8256_c0_g1_i4.p1 TRINITY_DN8256_c0_g1~~TRINITY_DN8256_c0_g1_i4.p1  ORF type:complete len:122 (-),score=20.51 TRINITY_DN8256_c0_g1_i4:29-364(-)
MQVPVGWQAFDFTLVVYEEGNWWSLTNALLSLVPQALGLVFLTAFLCRREFEIAYFVVVQVSSTVANKIIKDTIKQPRPPGSIRTGYGMPSDHAQFMFCFTTYLLLAFIYR